jgi:GAF domain-containing protein
VTYTFGGIVQRPSACARNASRTASSARKGDTAARTSSPLKTAITAGTVTGGSASWSTSDVSELAEQARRIAEEPESLIVRAERLAELVRRATGRRWVGIYAVDADMIRAVAWTGEERPAFPEFRRDQGLCGAAVSSREPVLVEDVRSDPRYLTTFGTTRSELVVPVLDTDGTPVGVIDVESAEADAFGEGDIEVLSNWARRLAPLL